MKKYMKYIMLQAVIIIYSFSTVMSKLASGEKENPIKFLIYFGVEILLMGVYAVLWQQMIKKFDLTIAYANRAMVILWSTIWAVIFFHDSITIQNIIGIVLVIIGLLLVNTEKEGV